MIEVIPTCVPATLTEFLEAARRVSAYAPVIHLDVDDGAFAPHLTWPYGAGQYEELVRASDSGAFAGMSRIAFDAHLMAEDPREAGILFARCGARRVTGHLEAFENASEAIGAVEVWRASGSLGGLSILLGTPDEAIMPLLSKVDHVQVMTIATIGVQGAPFEPRSLERIAHIHAARPDLPIMVDGGVGPANIAELAKAGATLFSVGSAISRAAAPSQIYRELLAAAETAAR